MDIIKIIQMVFTKYLLSFLIFCGIVLSVIYPAIIGNSKYKTEYNIGRLAGYVYIGIGVAMYIVKMLLS